jgi:endonuclease/exonuclease/phosphatase family metal-dependent hydrolase
MRENQLRILTYNLHKGFSTGNRHFILHKIRDALIESDADIMFLQEIQGQHTGHEKTQLNWPVCSHSEFLAHNRWPYFAYAKNVSYKAGHHGNAILSKYGIHHWENINVSPFAWASRSLLHGVINLPDQRDDLHVICIHLGLMAMERRRQFKTLCSVIEQHVPHDAPLIVAGDFNDWTGQAEKLFSKHLNLKEAYRTLHQHHAKTFPAWLPLLKMDRIYYRSIELLSCERPNRKHWTRLSDHAPLMATFQL